MKFPRVLAMVLAGGEGKRLHPLTAERSKPAVPFAGRYRVVDFVLSNLVNSGIQAIYLLVQYKSQSLIEHVDRAWVFSPILPDQFVTVVPAQMREGPEWYQGTADAVYQNLNLIERHAPELVAVFGADHIYRMDIRQMVDFHKQSGAHATVAAIPFPVAQASHFGVIETEGAGRITGFQEKPTDPRPMPGNPKQALCSMGNYLFDRDVLVNALKEARERGDSDFGHHVLPNLLHSHRLFAYNFRENLVPGVREYEEASYFRDIGSLDAYFAANQDLLGNEPRFNLFNPRWPIYSSAYQGPGLRVLQGDLGQSLIGAGTLVKGGRIRKSVIRQEAVIGDGAELDECVIMDHCVIREGTRLRRVIVDQSNVLDPGTTIGFDPEADRRDYHVTEGGITVVPQGRNGRPSESYFQP
ncbi:MAG: glucose-1-phosphate adenylyltransferase [Acidobacteria bacterium]|nr:glucose-1-phosphate adenylyltransferase [Acidobacteriota bacterium]